MIPRGSAVCVLQQQFDFGLARVVKRRNRVNARYEMTGETGSMRYMAPEVGGSVQGETGGSG